LAIAETTPKPALGSQPEQAPMPIAESRI
jgi:hypothetical protein